MRLVDRCSGRVSSWATQAGLRALLCCGSVGESNACRRHGPVCIDALCQKGNAVARPFWHNKVRSSLQGPRLELFAIRPWSRLAQVTATFVHRCRDARHCAGSSGLACRTSSHCGARTRSLPEDFLSCGSLLDPHSALTLREHELSERYCDWALHFARIVGGGSVWQEGATATAALWWAGAKGIGVVQDGVLTGMGVRRLLHFRLGASLLWRPFVCVLLEAPLKLADLVRRVHLKLVGLRPKASDRADLNVADQLEPLTEEREQVSMIVPVRPASACIPSGARPAGAALERHTSGAQAAPTRCPSGAQAAHERRRALMPRSGAARPPLGHDVGLCPGAARTRAPFARHSCRRNAAASLARRVCASHTPLGRRWGVAGAPHVRRSRCRSRFAHASHVVLGVAARLCLTTWGISYVHTMGHKTETATLQIGIRRVAKGPKVIRLCGGGCMQGA